VTFNKLPAHNVQQIY